MSLSATTVCLFLQYRGEWSLLTCLIEWFSRMCKCLIPGRVSRMYLRSKIQVQILSAAAVCLLMNIPYYFNYEIRECYDKNAGCNCTQIIYNQQPTIDFKMSTPIEGHIQETQSSIDPVEGIRLTGTNTTWIHCYTDFSKTILWQVWYIVYEVCKLTINEKSTGLIYVCICNIEITLNTFYAIF